jgi:subtilase family serine protease
MFSVHSPARTCRHRTLVHVEELETRALPSTLSPPYAPANLQSAYSFTPLYNSLGGLQNAGVGQTIALIEAYYDPHLDPKNGQTDLQIFDSSSQGFGLPDPPSYTLAMPYGTATASSKVLSNWAAESALDVEWAHAMAPGANILVVEAHSQSMSDLMKAVKYAANNGATVVSMSWGFKEFATETSSTRDGTFTHAGVTYVAASGDTGKPPIWPAVSPNVLAVGGTSLTINSNGTWNSEVGWGNLFGASGGGISTYEPQPAYQNGIVTQSTTQRTSPDVAYNADPLTGYQVYDGYNGGWTLAGGTSAGAPQWAAIIALADQARGSALGYNETLPGIYGLSSSDFHDITKGHNGYQAGPGYDLVTGIGTPIVSLLVPDLAAHAPAPGIPGRSAGRATTSGTSGQNAPALSLTLTARLAPPGLVADALVASSPFVTVSPGMLEHSDSNPAASGLQAGSLEATHQLQAQPVTTAPAAPAVDSVFANDLAAQDLPLVPDAGSDLSWLDATAE